MREPLKVLDLFSGIGGFSLGLERTGGFKTVAFCEIEEYPRRVLAKHWPGVPIHRDVRELRAEHVGAIDVICGGFPCQDISIAGKGAGIEGERSDLWREYARLIGELKPRWVIVENVAALLRRGMEVVLRDLATVGYDAEWHCIPASAAGAPHIRDRIWIIAYPFHSNAHSLRPHRAAGDVWATESGHEQSSLTRSLGALLADANRARLEGRGLDRQGADQRIAGQGVRSFPGEWLPEPNVGRVAHGIPSRVDRLRGLGNAVVPQVVEILGKAILQAEAIAA